MKVCVDIARATHNILHICIIFYVYAEVIDSHLCGRLIVFCKLRHHCANINVYFLLSSRAAINRVRHDHTLVQCITNRESRTTRGVA